MKRMDELDNKQIENAKWAGEQFQSRFEETALECILWLGIGRQRIWYVVGE